MAAPRHSSTREILEVAPRNGLPKQSGREMASGTYAIRERMVIHDLLATCTCVNQEEPVLAVQVPGAVSLKPVQAGKAVPGLVRGPKKIEGASVTLIAARSGSPKCKVSR